MHGVICKNQANLFTSVYVLNPNLQSQNTENIDVVAVRKLD